MELLIFDTETTGLPDFKAPADAPHQPRVCSFSAIHADFTVEKIEDQPVTVSAVIKDMVYHLIKPEGWTIHPEAAAVNNLTVELCEEQGVPIDDVLDYYEGKIRNRVSLAAFNAQFDCKMMRSEFRRRGRDDLFIFTKNSCLMRALQGVVPKPNGGRGWPKLEHACEFFGIEAGEAHTASGDTWAAFELTKVLMAKGHFLPPEVHRQKGRE